MSPSTLCCHFQEAAVTRRMGASPARSGSLTTRTTRCTSCTGPSARLTTATPWTPGEIRDMGTRWGDGETSYWPLRRHIGWSRHIAGPRTGAAATTTEASSSMAGTMQCREQACQRCWHLLPLWFCMSDCHNQKREARFYVHSFILLNQNSYPRKGIWTFLKAFKRRIFWRIPRFCLLLLSATNSSPSEE